MTLQLENVVGGHFTLSPGLLHVVGRITWIAILKSRLDHPGMHRADTGQQCRIGRRAGQARALHLGHDCGLDLINGPRHPVARGWVFVAVGIGRIVPMQPGVVAGQLGRGVVHVVVIRLELLQHVALHLPLELGCYVLRLHLKGALLGRIAQGARNVRYGVLQLGAIFFGEGLAIGPRQCVVAPQTHITAVLVVGQILRGLARLVDCVIDAHLVDLVGNIEGDASDRIPRTGESLALLADLVGCYRAGGGAAGNLKLASGRAGYLRLKIVVYRDFGHYLDPDLLY